MSTLSCHFLAFRVLAAATALSAGSVAVALVPPRVTLTATCSEDTPAAFGPGVTATDPDGSIHRLDGWNRDRTLEVATNVELVRRWRDTLASIGFWSIRYDTTESSWCGLEQRIEGNSHFVRWPVRLAANGSLGHHFEGLAPEVWGVYMQMQQAVR